MLFRSGTVTIKAEFEENKDYKASEVEEKLTVKGNINLKIEFSEDVGTVGEQIEITIEAKDQSGNLMDVVVNLYENDTYIDTVSVENGVGRYDYTQTDIGTVTIKAEFEENKDYKASEVEEKLTVKGSIDLKIEFSEETRTVGEQIEITIEAKDQSGNLMDVNVNLYADDIYLDTVSVVNGFGSYDYTTTDSGVVTITAEVEETKDYNAAETEKDLIVNNLSAGSSSEKKTTTKLNIVENVTPTPPVSEPTVSEPTISEPSISEPPMSESPVSESLKSINRIQIGLIIVALLSLVFGFGLYYRKK